MRIISTDRDHAWSVLADWMGAERVVFRGNVYDCLRFVRDAAA
jgi:hypothetical protein